MGAIIALLFGFKDPKDITTIGAGTCTFIVRPITGEAIGASSAAITLSVAAELVKSVTAMLLIPILGRTLKIKSPQAAMVMGGLIGTTIGTVAGLTALDEKLVPYGAMTTTFYTGLGDVYWPPRLNTLLFAL